MIKNKPIPIPIDVQNDRYAVNLQFWWDTNGVGASYNVPGLSDFLGFCFFDTFDVRSVQGNIALPRFRYITGSVTWQNVAGNDVGPFVIQLPSTGVTYVMYPSRVTSGARVSGVTFALPLILPVDGRIDFYKELDQNGKIVSGATVALLTWDESPFIASM